MLSKGLLLFAIVLLNGVTADVIDDDEISSVQGRKLLRIKPDWWALVKSDYEGDDLRMCPKKQDNPPITGQKCSRKVKTCFFGTQFCAGDVSYPSQKCYCDGQQGTRTWACEDTECPISFAPPSTTDEPPPPNVFLPPVDENGCPPDGAGFEIFNDQDRCPAKAAPGGTCTPAQEGASCEYGKSACCGKCHASMRCSCNLFGDGSWVCDVTDACNLPGGICPDEDPPRVTEKLPLVTDPPLLSADLVGMKCDPDAINAVLLDYPDFEVLCIEEGSIVTKDHKLDRIRLFSSAKTGNVSVLPKIG